MGIIGYKINKTSFKEFTTHTFPQRGHILTGIERLPMGDIKKLQGYTNSYRLRIGMYRVLFTTSNDTITIDDVLPRGDAYKG